MGELLAGCGYFCVVLTIGAFGLGRLCRRKWKLAIFDPILIGAALVMLALWALDIPVERYQQACQPLSYLMTPATICLAIAFYERLRELRRHLPAVLIGVVGGTLSSLLSVWLICKGLGLSQTLTLSLLPKSITSAIGMVLSEQAGGVGALTTAVIIVTGVVGDLAGPLLCRAFRLDDPISQGVAFGTASHVIGTSKAMELSPLAGAVSSLSLTLAGLITSVLFSFLF
ncbi:MAG: LrgB family protein [Oscillospiraceae bacterium]|nr:LrgB family protein [Oscillospiraceae bacterium]